MGGGTDAGEDLVEYESVVLVALPFAASEFASAAPCNAFASSNRFSARGLRGSGSIPMVERLAQQRLQLRHVQHDRLTVGHSTIHAAHTTTQGTLAE